MVNKVGSIGYIWKMHNWSGNYKNLNPRSKTERKAVVDLLRQKLLLELVENKEELVLLYHVVRL